jgi:hypothetical protein
MDARSKSVFKDKKVNECLSSLFDKYVVVSADNDASNNIIFACKNYYFECLIKELCISKKTGDPTYKNTSFDKGQINHKSFLLSLNIPIILDTKTLQES